MVRQVFVFIHRWAGLAMTVFLILVGLTGSLLAFKTDVERLICPRIYATPRPGVLPLDFATLAERAQTLVPHGRVKSVALMAPDQATVVMLPRKDPATGAPYELGFVQLILDPWSGEELGRRRPGDLSQGLINLMPFLLELHYTLALGGTGFQILGIVALVWTVDCFIAFYLTLPVSTGAFWRRWKPSWLVKWRAGAYRLNFDLHRAGGLWVWAMLLVFAWSSVMYNFGSVYHVATCALLDCGAGTSWAAMNPHPNENPRLDFRAALSTGERLMAEQAAKHGFSVQRAYWLYYQDGIYTYFVKSSLDVDEKYGATAVYFDADTGAFWSLSLPTGQHSGDTMGAWLSALHMADVFGLPYRIFVCVLGLVITMLSVTGVYIWWKKRKARIRANSRSASAIAPLARQT